MGASSIAQRIKVGISNERLVTLDVMPVEFNTKSLEEKMKQNISLHSEASDRWIDSNQFE